MLYAAIVALGSLAPPMADCPILHYSSRITYEHVFAVKALNLILQRHTNYES